MIPKHPDRVIQKAADTLSARLIGEKELYVRSTLGMHFHQHIRILVRKPTWMPGFLYNGLMRTIIIEEGPLEAGRRA